jgi:trigger factor
MWERMLHSLSHRGVTREAYLRVTGRSEEDVLEEMQPEAELALKREAVIAAVVAAERIEPGEQELLEVLGPTAEREDVEPQTLLTDLRAAGRLEDVREDLASRMAIDLIADAAKPIPPDQAHAREALWTPEKAAREEAGDQDAAPAGRLWTPDR